MGSERVSSEEGEGEGGGGTGRDEGGRRGKRMTQEYSHTYSQLNALVHHTQIEHETEWRW